MRKPEAFLCFLLVGGIVLYAAGCHAPAPQQEAAHHKKHHHAKHELKPEVAGHLPDSISESSGLVTLDGKTFWTHNDSRGDAVIFNIDRKGKLLRQISVVNEPNVDWEEITTDDQGNVFIGNFGNNNCDRRGLMIYRFHDPTLLKADTLDAEDIRFSLPDQKEFPPKAGNRNFDIEAMIDFNHRIYMFSKDRSEPHSGYSKMYTVPDVPGEYVATLVDSFYTAPGPMKENSITGAALNRAGNELILISHEKLWLFADFTGDHFFEGSVNEFSFSKKGLSMEGVCFAGNDEIWLSEERSAPGSGVLFTLERSDLEAE